MTKSTNEINLELNKPQKGNIKVHTQIINDLSSGIYSSPASCIKELVNNSYDADAKSVIIRVKPVNDSITIIDDGKGMNAVDFDSKFAWISHSTKRKDSQLSEKLNRPLIGKIGIGFIAVNEICEELEITSSKEGEEIKFTAHINFKEYFEEEASLEDDDSEKGIIKGEYNLINEEEDKEEHYTIIKLVGLKESVKDILNGKQYLDTLLKEKNKNYENNLFGSMKELMQFHSRKKLKSFSEDNAYVQFIIDLASYIPVEYIDGAPIESYEDSVINEIIAEHKELKFQVDLDGIYLKKPIYFEDEDGVFDCISFNEIVNVKNGGEIHLKGYFYINYGIIFPRELNGVSLRIRNIPIAEQFGFDESFMKYPSYTNQLFRNWVSGEIYILKGLEDAMNIDRKSFRITHPHYLALQNFLHKYLSEIVFKKTLKLYEGAKAGRDSTKKEEKKKEDRKILSTNKIEFKSKPKERKAKGDIILDKTRIESPIKILKNTKNNTVVEVNQSIAKKFKKKDWEYLESVFLIFESSLSESKGDVEKLRDLFYKKINIWKDIDE
jgi:hypothetical protein